MLRELLEYATDEKDKEFLTKITTNNAEGKVSASNTLQQLYRIMIFNSYPFNIQWSLEFI